MKGIRMKKSTLTQLVLRLQENDETAFNELYNRYRRLVYYIAFQLTKNHADAEEIVQETFVQVQRSISALKDPTQFKAWIGKIAHSKTITMLRRKRDQQMSDLQLEILSNETEDRMDYCPEYMNHYLTDMQILHRCLLELKPQYREVLILYFFVQLNNKEISELLHCPLGTVKSRLLYGKKYLKEAIQQYEKENDIKLSFRASSIETLLVTACASLAPVSYQTWLSYPLNMFSYRLPYVKIAMIALMCSGTLYGGYQLTEYYRSDQERIDDKGLFSDLYFENTPIHTPREAYEILLNYAHCEDDIKKLNQEQLNQLFTVYDSLKQYGGTYYELLYTYYWDVSFKKLVENSFNQL